MLVQPLVSIIIPTFNRAHLIGETLDSILAQTYTHWECIVVDDGSTDGTQALVTNYIDKDSRFQFHKRPNSHLPGGNGARNYGFELSQGDYIQWFDSDDLMLPHFISLKVILFNNNIDFVVCEGALVNAELKKEMSLTIKVKEYIFKDYLFWNAQILTPSVLFKKSFLKGKLLFNENLTKGQETEFFSRLFYKIHEDSYAIAGQELFLYRYHEHSKTTQNETYIESYKASISYTYIQNLKRSIALHDLGLIRFNYEPLMRLYYEAYSFNDVKNRKYITKEMSRLFIDKPKYLDIIFLLNVMTIFRFNSYKLYVYLRKRQINF